MNKTIKKKIDFYRLFKILFLHLTYLGRVALSASCFLFLFCFFPSPPPYFPKLADISHKDGLVLFLFFLTLVSTSLLKSVGYISFLLPSSFLLSFKEGQEIPGEQQRHLSRALWARSLFLDIMPQRLNGSPWVDTGNTVITYWACEMGTQLLPETCNRRYSSATGFSVWHVLLP